VLGLQARELAAAHAELEPERAEHGEYGNRTGGDQRAFRGSRPPRSLERRQPQLVFALARVELDFGAEPRLGGSPFDLRTPDALEARFLVTPALFGARGGFALERGGARFFLRALPSFTNVSCFFGGAAFFGLNALFIDAFLFVSEQRVEGKK
jgi:hypothetical protein